MSAILPYEYLWAQDSNGTLMSLLLDIIVMSNLPHSAGYHEKCVASVHTAIGNADFPCRLVATKGDLKAIAKARGAAFDQTAAPYVTWVVDFDYLKPDALAVLAPHFKTNPSAIFTREKRISARGTSMFPNRHHLAVYRRDVVAAIRGMFDTSSVNETTPLLRKIASAMGRTVDVHHWGYVRNVMPEVNAIYQSEIPA